MMDCGSRLSYAWQVLCLLLEFLAQVAALNSVNEMTSEVLSQVRSFI